jgi:hypothetical protein
MACTCSIATQYNSLVTERGRVPKRGSTLSTEVATTSACVEGCVGSARTHQVEDLAKTRRPTHSDAVAFNHSNETSLRRSVDKADSYDWA